MRNTALTFAGLALLCALAGPAFAQENEPSPAGRWYGGQILLADAASYGSIAAGLSYEVATPLALMGSGTYLFAPAVIHGVHRHGGRTAVSILMRAAFPLIGWYVGAGAADCGSPDASFLCGLEERLLGFGIGMVAASIVDATIAWDSAAPAQPPPSPPSTKHSAVSFTTAGLAPTTSGPRLMIGGRF